MSKRKIKMFAGDCRRRNEELDIKLSYTPASEPESHGLNNTKMHVSHPHKKPCQTNQSLKDKKSHLHETQMRTGNQAESGETFLSTGPSCQQSSSNHLIDIEEENDIIERLNLIVNTVAQGESFIRLNSECQKLSSSNPTGIEQEDCIAEMTNLVVNAFGLGEDFVGSGPECRQFSSSKSTDNDEEDKRNKMIDLIANILKKGETYFGIGPECEQFSRNDPTEINQDIYRTEIANLIDNTLTQVMQFPTSYESKHLSAFLNVCQRSLAVVKLEQDSVKILNKVWKLLNPLCNHAPHALSGSLAEGLSVPGSDGDCTMFAPNIKVLEKIEEYDNTYPGIQVLRFPDEGHPGYSKLHVIIEMILQNKAAKNVKILLKNNLKNNIFNSKTPFHFQMDFSNHGPAFTCNMSFDNVELFLQKAGTGTQIYNPNKESSESDIVFCIKSKRWPNEALEWTTRRRSSNWPPKELFNRIINAGYLLAAVGSKESEESDFQWRVSFNKAEQLIIESFNETQIHCIFLLKFLKIDYLSKTAGKNITSYTLKNVMFWCLEEKSDAFWQYSNLVCCFLFCLAKLKYFIEQGCLPNYFIRKRNLFILNEFSSDMQIKTIQFLQSFLEDPKAGISLILTSYKFDEIITISKIDEVFIERWLVARVTKAAQFHGIRVVTLESLYDGYNINHILTKCNLALKKLSPVRYTQSLIKNLQNYIGVLQYILLKEKDHIGEHRDDSDTRETYSKYLKLSALGDLTHTKLRNATCYLDDGVKEECIKTIKAVTDSEDNFFMQAFSERLKQTLHRDIAEFRDKKHTNHEIDQYKIIYDIDVRYNDPYRTADQFEQMKERGHVLIGYDSFILAWKRCYFDVTFMLAELPILPKPAALELCIDLNQKRIQFHSFIYGLLLEFLWHEKHSSTNGERSLVLEKMTNCVSMLPDDQKSKALNFITYCYSLHNDHCSASRYLIRSFKLNPVRQNVAYLYIQYVINLLRKLSFAT